MSGFPSRRGVLIYGATGVVTMCGAAGVGAVLACQQTGTELSNVAKQLRVALADIPEPQRLAAWWRVTKCQAGQVNPLTAELQASLELQAVLPLSCEQARRTRINALFQQEFQDGDIVVADRLVVARSECLVSAICLQVDTLARSEANWSDRA